MYSRVFRKNEEQREKWSSLFSQNKTKTSLAKHVLGDLEQGRVGEIDDHPFLDGMVGTECFSKNQ